MLLEMRELLRLAWEESGEVGALSTCPRARILAAEGHKRVRPPRTYIRPDVGVVIESIFAA
jgi:hypothetical protein